MTELSDEDVERIAKAITPLLIRDVKRSHHEFWIDPETHYRSHLASDNLAKIFDPEMVSALKGMATAYKKGNSIFWKIFLSFSVLGLISMAVAGWFSGKSS